MFIKNMIFKNFIVTLRTAVTYVLNQQQKILKWFERNEGLYTEEFDVETKALQK